MGKCFSCSPKYNSRPETGDYVIAREPEVFGPGCFVVPDHFAKKEGLFLLWSNPVENPPIKITKKGYAPDDKKRKTVFGKDVSRHFPKEETVFHCSLNAVAERVGRLLQMDNESLESSAFATLGDEVVWLVTDVIVNECDDIIVWKGTKFGMRVCESGKELFLC